MSKKKLFEKVGTEIKQQGERETSSGEQADNKGGDKQAKIDTSPGCERATARAGKIDQIRRQYATVNIKIR